jgi:hopanoid biosynthesis associated RND transporter like protein HpnN
MSTEWMPQDGEEGGSVLARPHRVVTRWVCQFPFPVLAVGILVTLASMSITAKWLGFHGSRANLLNPKSEYHQRWLRYTEEFSDREDVVVVVEGPDRETIVAATDELAEAIARQPQVFEAELHVVDPAKLRAKGLYFLPAPQLAQIDGFLAQVRPVVEGDWARLSVGGMLGQMLTQAMAAGAAAADPSAPGPQGVVSAMGSREEMESHLLRTFGSLKAAFGPKPAYQPPWPEIGGDAAALQTLAQPKRFITGDNRLGFLLTRLAQRNDEQLDQFTTGLDALRAIAEQTQARYQGVKIGLTGLPVIENDEMLASQGSMTAATIVSFVGVCLVFVAGFGGVRHPVMANIALVLGTTWAFGYTTLVIGHLNILSCAFGAILIGQGLDFGVYYLARYLQVRRDCASAQEALVETAGSVGPGIMVGAISTAIAFYTASFTEFTGVAELGIIAAGGILLCWVAAMVLLPAMIQAVDSRMSLQTVPGPLNLDEWLRPLYAYNWLGILATIGGTVFLATGLGKLWYDYNLLNLQPVGLESVKLEKRLLNETGESAWFAISLADSPAEVLARKAKFLKLDCVERVEEIASALPEGIPSKQPMVARIHEQLTGLPEQPPQIPVTDPMQMQQILGGWQQVATMAGMKPELGQTIAEVRQMLAQTDQATYYARLTAYQQACATDLLTRLSMLHGAASPEPPSLADLPEGLVTRFVGKHGKYLMRVYAKGDIWDVASMERFVHNVRGVDPEATGNPMQVYESAGQMKRSYQLAAWYAFFTVVPVVFFDFFFSLPARSSIGLLLSSLGYTALALLPLGMGMVQMFGLMGLMNMPLNPANMIVLPLILGIGIDNGVHVVHDYCEQRSRYRLSAGTANAVVINSLGNMVGFGGLMIASHQGLQSLGRVLTIGMACCLVSALAMPNLFMIIQRFRGQDASPEESETAEDESRFEAEREPVRAMAA